MLSGGRARTISTATNEVRLRARSRTHSVNLPSSVYFPKIYLNVILSTSRPPKWLRFKRF